MKEEDNSVDRLIKMELLVLMPDVNTSRNNCVGKRERERCVGVCVWVCACVCVCGGVCVCVCVGGGMCVCVYGGGM